MPLPLYYKVYNFLLFKTGTAFPNMSNLSTHNFSRNESDTLKYSTRPRQVILFPLISLMSRLSGLSSQGMSIFKFLMNSSSISTSKSKFIIILKILSSPPCHKIKHPLISSVSSPVIKYYLLSHHLNYSRNPLFSGWMILLAQTPMADLSYLHSNYLFILSSTYKIAFLILTAIQMFYTPFT